MTTDKQIRIITSGYADQFKIKDGDELSITGANGVTRCEVCKYVDAYHFYFGETLYHIHQFAKNVEFYKLKVTPMRKSLPDKCYALNDTNIVEVHKGVEGYYATSMSEETFEAAEIKVRQLNEELGVTRPQAMAMVAGSMFGWDKPAANPDNYNENGKLKSKSQILNESCR